MRTLVKNFLIVLAIFLLVSTVFTLFSEPFQKKQTLSLTQVVQDINQDKIKTITVSGNDLQIVYQDDTKIASQKETETALSQSLINYGVDKTKLAKVEINLKQSSDVWNWLAPLLLMVLPLLIIGFFFWGMFKQARTGAMQAFDFTKARARLFGAEGHPKQKITFQDVAGLKEAKQELAERGIIAKATHPKVLAEESPGAYKPINDIIDSVHGAGISLKIVRLEPMGVCKG